MHIKFVILFIVLTTLTFSINAQEDIFLIEDSLDKIVNEAAEKTGTQETDRKQKEFDEVSGRKRESTNETVKEPAKTEKDQTETKTITEETSTEKILEPKNSSKGTVITDSYVKDDTVLSDTVYHIKKLKIKNRKNVSKVNIKISNRSKIDKIELFTFNTPVKIHQMYIITDKNEVYTKFDINVTKEAPYLLNLMEKKIKKLIIIHQSSVVSNSKDYLFVLGIKNN